MRHRLSFPCCVVLAFLGSLPLASKEIPIDGRVRDSGGVALAGVRVELRPILSNYEQGMRELDGRAVEPAARTVTGADGRFQVSAPGEGMWEVGVSAEGFVPLRFRLTPLIGPETLPPATLRRDASLRVRIEGPDGRPLSGARVVGRHGREEKPGWQTVPRIAVSGADGVAQLAASRDESLMLLATAPGFPVQEGPEVRGPAEVTIRLLPGTPRRVDAPEGALLRDLQTSLVMGRGGDEVAVRGESWLLLETAEGVRVRFQVKDRAVVPGPAVLPGRVIDTAARQPVAGAWVWVRDDPGRFVRTDDQGGYRIHAAADLEITAAGHLPEIVDDEIPRPEGALPPVALEPEVVLVATVLDGEGKPAAGAEVSVFVKEETWFPNTSNPLAPRAGRVSAEGEVRIAGLRPGCRFDLVASGPGYAPAWLEEGWLKARVNRVRIALDRGSRVSGRLEDAQGRPVADAEVVIEPGAGIPRKSVFEDPLHGSERRAATGPDGGFAFAEVPPGWHEMTVVRQGSLRRRLPRFEVREGVAAALGALRLDEPGVMAARVVDPEGRPVAGAEVWAGIGDGGDAPVAATGPDGSFSLAGYRGQRLAVTVCSPGFIPLGMVLGPFFPEEPLVLTLRPGAGLSGRVTGGDGLPVAGQYVYMDLVGTPESIVSHDCAGEGWRETDAAGRFRVAGLEPGLYSVSYVEKMTLAAGESREVALVERRGTDTASLSGRLVGSDGQPMPGALIALSSTEDRGAYQVSSVKASRTDADGSYRLSFSRPGLKIEPSSLGIVRHGQSYFSGFSATWEGPDTVEAEGRYDVRVERFPKVWEPEAEIGMKDQRPDPQPVSGISGRILGLEPGELARIQVTASRLGWYTEETAASIDPDGTWRLEGLSREAWQIHAEAAGRHVFETVHIPKGEARIARDLVFPPVAEVSVQVETLENEPVPGATVTLRHFAGPFETRWPVMEIRTGSDGSFSARLPMGEYGITAAKEGFTPPENLPGSSLTVDEKGDTATLWLRPAVELTGRLTGLPEDESEVKIEAARVDRYQRLEGKMVAEGRYVIPGLGPGTWNVKAQYYAMGVGDQEAKGRVVISEEATAAVLDLELKVPVP